MRLMTELQLFLVLIVPLLAVSVYVLFSALKRDRVRDAALKRLHDPTSTFGG